MGESPEKTPISFESQSEDRSQKSEDRSQKIEVGPQSTGCLPADCESKNGGNAGTGAVIRVQAGDAGGGLEIALDWVFDCKYLYEHKEVIVSIPKQAFGELGPGFEGVTQGCFNMDT